MKQASPIFRHFYCLFLCFYLISPTFSQDTESKRCGLEINTLDEEFQKRLSELIRQKKNQQAIYRTEESEEIYRIPVVFHIIHQGEPIGTSSNLSANQVYSQFAVINQDFRRLNIDTTKTPPSFKPVAADTRIEFVLAQLDPFGVPLKEAGINRYHGERAEWTLMDFNQMVKPATIWDTNNYLNIWVANLQRGVLGYATLPTFAGIRETSNWGALSGNEQTDGVVIDIEAFGSNRNGNFFNINRKFNLGRTLTHEIGHYLGLLHISGDGGCDKDDFCDDTPLQSGNSNDCQVGRMTCNSINMIENYMDYSDDSCLNLFTQQQVLRMRTVMENSPRRQSLRFSRVGEIPRNGVYAFFDANRNVVCPSQTISFNQKAVILGNDIRITGFQWIFPNGTPSSSTAPNPRVTYNQSGVYDVVLIVRSNSNIDTLVRRGYVNVRIPQETTLFQNFDNTSNPLSGDWKTVGDSWGRANIGSFGTTSNSLVANNTRNNSRESRLISPIINTQNKAILEINFDVSYKAIAQKADSLEIMVSMDCGDSFSTIWKRGGDFLGTTVPSLFRTNPRFDDWKRVKIYANINNSNTAQFIFKNLNKEGNSIYIDNIVIQPLSAEQVTVPQVDWVATPNFLLRNERSIIEENVQGVAVDLAWNFPNAVPNTSSERILYVQYPTQGTQNITLRANNLINQNTVSKPAIQVISGKKLSNINNKPLNIKTLGNNNYLAGHNFFRDNAKAEYFSDFGKYELLHGADIFFAYVELFNSLSEVTFTIWSEQDGKPSQILASQKVNFAEIKRDVIRRQPTRIILNNPIPAPESFFVGIQLNYSPFSNEKVAIYTAETLRNTGWELTNTNIWQRYDKPAVAKTAAVALSHAIFPIVSPEVGIYDKDFANRKVLLYPNPTNNSVKIDYEDIKILSCQIYNYLGQLVKNYDNVPENLAEINLSSLESGLYLIVFETDKGKAVKKLILYN